MRTTVVSSGNTLLAPLIGLIRASPSLSSASRVGILLGAFDEMGRSDGLMAPDQSRAMVTAER